MQVSSTLAGLHDILARSQEFAQAVDLAPKGQEKLVKKQAAIAQAQASINPRQVTPSTGGTTTSGG